MSEEGLGVEVLDVAGTDGIFFCAEVFLDGDAKPLWQKIERSRIPEDWMDKLEEIVGDGNAAVTVGMDMKSSENFNTAGCSVFVKLTCGQTLDQVNAARDAAHKMALSFVYEGYEHAKFVLDQARGIERDPPEGMVKQRHLPEEERPPKKTKSKDPEPDRGQKRDHVKLIGAPKFRR
jgi:hypothetical protein